MARGVTKETLLDILAEKGFERCNTPGNAHIQLMKKFAPGVGVEVTLFTGYSVIESAAFLDFSELFPFLNI